jgi:RNA polymerase primary sigma factor
MRDFKIVARPTNREIDSFKQYLKNISSIDMLTREEETELAMKSSAGDEKAINELVRRNLRFVVSVAKSYASAANPLEDLVNEGNVGLIIAAKKFKPNMDAKFISYAVWWVRKVIMEYLSKHGRTVRIPANKLNSLSKLDKKFNELEQREGRIIDINEVINELSGELPNDSLEFLTLLNSYNMDSLDREIGSDDSTTTLGDLLTTDSYKDTDHLVNGNDIKNEIGKLVNTLNDKEKRIIIASYGLDGSSPMTLGEIGEEMGVTRERIRQIKDTILRKLKSKIVNSNLLSQL